MVSGDVPNRFASSSRVLRGSCSARVSNHCSSDVRIERKAIFCTECFSCSNIPYIKYRVRGYTLVMEPDELTEEEALWDALFSTPESLALLTELAWQALSEYLAGETVSLDELLELSEESDELCE
jgi:hypothetical protein